MFETPTGHSLENNGGIESEQIREILLQKTWFGFDLDDTLHEFRKASKAAARETLLLISSKHKIPISELEETYSLILSQNTAHAFTDGKTSDEYRKERFSAVLNEHSLATTPSLLTTLTTNYKSSLALSLTPKPGASSLLSYLKSLNKKILIITEGPQDAQEWTLEKLGLADKIDFLATTNQFGVSKNDGLFEMVMERLGVRGEEMVFVGDNWGRDVLPARSARVLAIHYCEDENTDFCVENPRINELGQLEGLLQG